MGSHLSSDLKHFLPLLWLWKGALATVSFTTVEEASSGVRGKLPVPSPPCFAHCGLYKPFTTVTPTTSRPDTTAIYTPRCKIRRKHIIAYLLSIFSLSTSYCSSKLPVSWASRPLAHQQARSNRGAVADPRWVFLLCATLAPASCFSACSSAPPWISVPLIEASGGVDVPRHNFTCVTTIFRRGSPMAGSYAVAGETSTCYAARYTAGAASITSTGAPAGINCPSHSFSRMSSADVIGSDTVPVPTSPRRVVRNSTAAATVHDSNQTLLLPLACMHGTHTVLTKASVHPRLPHRQLSAFISSEPYRQHVGEAKGPSAGATSPLCIFFDARAGHQYELLKHQRKHLQATKLKQQGQRTETPGRLLYREHHQEQQQVFRQAGSHQREVHFTLRYLLERNGQTSVAPINSTIFLDSRHNAKALVATVYSPRHCTHASAPSSLITSAVVDSIALCSVSSFPVRTPVPCAICCCPPFIPDPACRCARQWHPLSSVLWSLPASRVSALRCLCFGTTTATAPVVTRNSYVPALPAVGGFIKCSPLPRSDDKQKHYQNQQQKQQPQQYSYQLRRCHRIKQPLNSCQAHQCQSQKLSCWRTSLRRGQHHQQQSLCCGGLVQQHQEQLQEQQQQPQQSHCVYKRWRQCFSSSREDASGRTGAITATVIRSTAKTPAVGAHERATAHVSEKQQSSCLHTLTVEEVKYIHTSLPIVYTPLLIPASFPACHTLQPQKNALLFAALQFSAAHVPPTVSHKPTAESRAFASLTPSAADGFSTRAAIDASPSLSSAYHVDINHLTALGKAAVVSKQHSLTSPYNSGTSGASTAPPTPALVSNLYWTYTPPSLWASSPSASVGSSPANTDLPCFSATTSTSSFASSSAFPHSSTGIASSLTGVTIPPSSVAATTAARSSSPSDDVTGGSRHQRSQRHSRFTVFSPVVEKQVVLKWLQRVHALAYVDDAAAGNLSEQQQRNIGLPVTSGFLQKSLAEVSCTVLGGALAATLGLVCVVGGGTHHAKYSEGGKYCLFNDVAVAAALALEQGLARRVLILDLDVHQGDGTAAIFKNNPHVTTVSVHCENNFPFVKEVSDVDVSLPSGVGDHEYLRMLDDLLPRLLREVRPSLLFYNAGVDVHAEDTLGTLLLTDAGLQQRDTLVLQHCLDYNKQIAAAQHLHKSSKSGTLWSGGSSSNDGGNVYGRNNTNGDANIASVVGSPVGVCCVIGGGYSKDIRDVVYRHSVMFK